MGESDQVFNPLHTPPLMNEHPISSPPTTSYKKNTSFWPLEAMPFMSAPPGGLSTLTGPDQVAPLSVEVQTHRLLPPVPLCPKALMVPELFEMAQPPSSNMLPEPPLRVVHVVHWLPIEGSVTRCT